MDRISVFVVMMIIFVSVLGAGCVAPILSGSLHNLTEQIEAGTAESARVEILMGAGTLRIDGGAKSLLDANIRYNHPSLAPDIHYRVNESGLGFLDIEQEEFNKFRVPRNYRNEWDLAFNNEIPLELMVMLGAGECDLDLGDLNLKSFTMQMGAGESTLDLIDYAGEDLVVDIQGGVGELTVFLPAGIQVEVSITGGLGEVQTSGMERKNGLYVTGGPDAGSSIEIQIQAGIGEVNLIAR